MSFSIIVIGASAGGQDALCKVIASLPKNIDAAVFVVLHLPPTGSENFLTRQLQKYTPLPCVLVSEGLPIFKGYIYVALLDHHLILKEGTMHTPKGPAENRWRPSIDVLFRSAAVYHKERVIGIVLTGLLDDGTVGIQAIKRCGGTAIVQDPRDAAYPDMPQSVLDNTIVDFVLPASDMHTAIMQTIASVKSTGIVPPPELVAETGLIERSASSIDEVSQLGEHSVYTCPDCGGGLWQIKEEGGVTRFRCHIGHAYTLSELLRKQYDSLNTSLEVALRVMEERKNLLNRISQADKMKNLHSLAEMHAEGARDLEAHINNLKQLLFNVKRD